MKIGKYELNNIYNEDCYEAIKNIPDKSIDLIVTDPPYEIYANGGGGAFGVENRNYHNDVSKKLNYGVSNELLKELVRVMKKINIYIWCNKTQLRQYLDFFEELGATADLLTWHKTNPIPTCNNKYLSDTEYCLYFRKDSVPLYGNYETKKKYYISATNIEDKKMYKHPTIKPINIIKNLIINSSKENDIVFDPFVGSGTTALAAKELGRNYIGFEIESNYHKIAVNRINGLTAEGQTSIYAFID